MDRLHENRKDIRKRFKAICKNKFYSEDTKREKIKLLGLEYKPELLTYKRENIAEQIALKQAAIKEKNDAYVNLDIPDDKTHDLNLAAPLRFRSLWPMLTLILLIFNLLFILIPLILLPVEILRNRFRFKGIEKNDIDNLRYSKIHRHLQFEYSSIRDESKFENGNYRGGQLRKRVNGLYEQFVVPLVDNPFELDTRPVALTSGFFTETGGIYAGLINDEIRYIGKTNNFRRRMEEHIEGLRHPELHNENKYHQGGSPEHVAIKILAVTPDEDEQSVLESFYFDKYNSDKLVNAVGTLSGEKILTKEKYRNAWEHIQNSITPTN